MKTIWQLAATVHWYFQSFLTHWMQAGGTPGMKRGGGNFLGSVPWISLFKVFASFFLSSSSICKLIEFISSTCFTYFFVCWLVWVSNGFRQPSKIELSSSQLLVNRFCIWLGGVSWEFFNSVPVYVYRSSLLASRNRILYKLNIFI